MSTKPEILLVEDDAIAAMVAEEMLSHAYWVRHADSGQAALTYLATELPDLVLLDVDMPEMTGYEVCRAMRRNLTTRNLPVIFLSGMVGEQDRLAGYEAGGNDYLTKPVSSDELCAKIKLLLHSQSERGHLKNDFANAFSTAIAAMTSAAEIGAVLQFLRTSFICPDYATLCHEVLNTLGAYGLDAIVQIRGQQPSVCCGTSGSCLPMEESVLSHVSGNGQLFEFASLTSCSYEHITIVVKSDADSDPERHGRMKDNLVMLAEGADARVAALDNEAIISRYLEK